jgi:thiamine transporter ThiT
VAVNKGKSRYNTKIIVYIAIMAALGTAVSILTINTVQLGATQISLDLSHLGTFMTAIPGGAILGAITGAIVGIYPGIAFGYIWGQLGIVGLIGLPLGKAMAGFTSGAVQKTFKRPFLSVILGYVPECLFTIWLFVFLVPVLTPIPAEFVLIIALGIVGKAWIEILFMAFLMETLFLSRGIVRLVKTIFTEWDYTPLTDL